MKDMDLKTYAEQALGTLENSFIMLNNTKDDLSKNNRPVPTLLEDDINETKEKIEKLSEALKTNNDTVLANTLIELGMLFSKGQKVVEHNNDDVCETTTMADKYNNLVSKMSKPNDFSVIFDDVNIDSEYIFSFYELWSEKKIFIGVYAYVNDNGECLEKALYEIMQRGNKHIGDIMLMSPARPDNEAYMAIKFKDCKIDAVCGGEFNFKEIEPRKFSIDVTYSEKEFVDHDTAEQQEQKEEIPAKEENLENK